MLRSLFPLALTGTLLLMSTPSSVALGGVEGNRESGGGARAAASSDGRYVAFDSAASNLVSNDTNNEPDVFVHDDATGETTRVSVDSAGNQANAGSLHVAMSADGRYVAFASYASNLVSGGTNGMLQVFVHDRDTGETTLASTDSAGNQ
ncbi:MAG: hypothetical protein ABR978_09035, partial [Dehalococcoidia bacterium]